MVPRLAVAFLLVTAGCTAVDGGSSATPSAAPTTSDRPATPSPPPTSTTPTTRSTTEPVAPTASRPTEANTVAYESLPATQQRAFDRALDGQAQFVDDAALDSPHVGDDYFARDAAAPFRAHEYVRKNGTHYRLSYREGGGQALATYGIEAIREEPSEDADVVALQNVSTRIREPVRWAVENGSYYVPAGKWYSLPPAFDRFDYVRVDGDHYRISIVYGDFFADALEAEPVE